MVGSAAVVPGWPWTADAGRRTRDRNSGGATGRSSGWRSGAARRGQAAARVADPVIPSGRQRLELLGAVALAQRLGEEHVLGRLELRVGGEDGLGGRAGAVEEV